MKQILSMTLVMITLSFGPLAFAKNCKNGKACGNSCIAKDKECAASATGKTCKKGKACGNSCIPKDKECKK